MGNRANNSVGEIEAIIREHGIWRSYDAVDGLSGGVQCLLQDRQGYLWLGTQAGLYRYSGTEFISYTSDDGLIDNDIYAICEDRQGRLWLGTRRGVSCFDGERFTNYTNEDGLAGNSVTTICEDRAGRIWLGTEDGGISYFDGERFTDCTTGNGLTDRCIRTIYEDSMGRLWFGTDVGPFLFDERFPADHISGELAGKSIQAIYEDSRGRIWFGTRIGVFCLDGERTINYTVDDGLAGNDTRGICEDYRGHIWFGTRGGISCFDGRRFINYTTQHGLPDNRVGAVTRDQEGLLWFSHPFSGLTCFDPRTVQLITTESVTEILIQDAQARLWFSNEKKLCCISQGEQRCRTFNSTIFSLLEDSRGAFWIGTLGKGLYHCDSADDVWGDLERKFKIEDGLCNSVFISLLEARDGTIWAGTAVSGCLCRFDGKVLERIPTSYPSILRLLEDSRGRIWMGGPDGGGLSCYDGQKLVSYTLEDGLPDNAVQSILEDDTGLIWIGTQHGLCNFDGHQFNIYGKEQGILDLNHQWSAKDASGQLWFGTLRGGVYRFDGKHFQMLTTADGLPSNSVTGLLPQADGSMIIGTYRGIAHYRPTAFTPPSIEIREVVADQIYTQPDELSLTTRETGFLTISYCGLGLATRRMRYSYILEGYDEEWHDTWDSHVRYENLPVGEYTFKVIAINRDLIRSKAPAVLSIIVAPDQWNQLRAEYEAEIEHMQKLLQLSRRVSDQSTLSDTAFAVVEELCKLGFDRAGVWIRDVEDEQLHGLWGVDMDGNMSNNEDEFWLLDDAPCNDGYYIIMDRPIMETGESAFFFLKDQDEGIFEAIWGYPPPFPGHYQRDEWGDNICLCVTAEGERIVVIAVDNYITRSHIDETSANLLGLVGTEMAKVLANVALRESLAQTEAKNRAMLDAIPDLIFRISRDGVYLDYKAAIVGEFYIQEEGVIGRNIRDLMPPEFAKLALHYIHKALDSGDIQIFEYQLPASQDIRDYEARLVVSGKDEVLVVIRDVTRRKRMEEELLKVQKLESIGILAGGIAHDFNNILTATLGNISLARMYEDPADKDRRLIEAERASMQARDLTQQLLTFSRGGAPVLQNTSITELIKDCASFVLRGSNVRCDLSIPDDLWPVRVDEGQISQVINNIVINADQAMPEGGIIKVCAENMAIGMEHALPLKNGEYIRISIADQGIGIKEEYLRKIFDPFFTTKQKGNGLGLATSYSIVKNHSGHITVESEMGIGTTFRIYLPACPEEVLTDREEVKVKLVMGEGKVLVMDDEKRIRDLAEEMLSSLGYSITTAVDGSEAVEIYQEAMESGTPFGAVIMDLTVPGGMGGKEAIRKLIEVDPEVRAIVSSGYSNDPIMSDFREYGFSGFIAKPYRVGELSAALHRATMTTEAKEN